MTVLSIFTCYNRKEKTIACIESIMKNESKIEFIVVDDNSSDGTSEALKKYKNISVLSGNGQLFYSGGMRMAIDAAKKRNLDNVDYILLLNDDVVFFDHSIDEVISFAKGMNAIIACATCDDAGEISYGGVVRTSYFRPKYKIVKSSKNDIKYCDTFCANCVLIPKDIFIRLPNIDRVYTHAMGDYDYGLEAKREGYSIVASAIFVGICNDNSIQGTWCDRNLKRKERLRKKESPKGLPFFEYFHFLMKNHGFWVAIPFSILPYIKILLGL